MKRMSTSTPTLVSAKVVAAFLGVQETTIYSLCRGVRGWKKIEALPFHGDRYAKTRQRYSFDLAAVAAWVDRTKFKVMPQGRRAHNSNVVETH